MKNIIKLIVSGTFVVLSLAILPTFAIAQVNGGDDESAAVVSGGDDTAKSAVSNGSDDVAKSAVSNGSDDVSKSAVSNGNDDTTKSAVSNGSDDVKNPTVTNGSDDVKKPTAVSNGDDDVTPVVTPPTPTTPPTTNPGDNNQDDRRSRGSGPRRNNDVITPILPVLINASGCSYLTTFMGINSENDSAEVTKLQTFLKNVEKLDVDINGTFDQKTLDAVKAFQEKYVDEVMTPWGVNTPTGQVFYTTQKKVNEIVCKTSINLTAEQLSAIDAYKNSLQNGTQTDSNGQVIGDATSTNPVVGTNDNGQTASVAKTSIAAKIWGFIKWLFGYDK